MSTPALSTRSSAFTLVELMIVVVIIGVLASLAIPGFRYYKDKVRFAESYNLLSALLTGAKAYYHEEHWPRGVVTTVGLVGPSTYCTVPNAWTGNTPGKKTVLDWQSEPDSFRALNFQPADPIYFRYFVGASGSCGSAPNTESLIALVAFGDFDDSAGGYHAQQWIVCSNATNELYVCSRLDSPTIAYNP